MRATRPTGRTTPMTRPNGTPTAMAIPNPNASDWRLVAVALRIAPERRSATSAVSVAHGDGKLKLIGTRAAHSHSRTNAITEAARSATTTSACRCPSARPRAAPDRKSTRLNSSHGYISYAVFCLKKKIQLQVRGKVKELKWRKVFIEEWILTNGIITVRGEVISLHVPESMVEELV